MQRGVVVWVVYEIFHFCISVIIVTSSNWRELSNCKTLEAPLDWRNISQPRNEVLRVMRVDAFQTDHVASKQSQRKVEDWRKCDGCGFVSKDAANKIAHSGGSLHEHHQDQVELDKHEERNFIANNEIKQDVHEHWEEKH